MTLVQLKAFLYVAHSRSYVDAAEKLHLSQPALSISIRKLEEEMGGKLFVRNTRNIQLTPEGEGFLPVAQRLVIDWESAAVDLKHRFSLQQGQLALAAMPSFSARYLPDLLGAMRAQHPQILVKVSDVTMEVVIEHVLDERAELGITFEPRSLAGLDFIPLMNDRFIVACSASHALAKQKSVSWERLQQFDVLAMNQGAALRVWQEDVCEKIGVKLNLVCHAHQLNTLMQLVSGQLGIAVFPGFCRALLHQLDLVTLELTSPHLDKPVGIVTRSRAALSQPALKMIEITQHYFSECSAN